MASQVKDIKIVPGISPSFIVDGFKFTSPFVRHYFLTHTHSDHTIGLSKSFDRGFIYCSEVASRLLVFDMGIRRDIVRPLALNTTVTIMGVNVTPINANHCPGAVMFLFERQDGCRILHTGDCRWSDDIHGRDPLLMHPEKTIDIVMLDTTYCDPKYVFPKQEHVVLELARFIGLRITKEPRTLFVFMSYHIGKERAYFGAAEICNLKVYVTPNKRKVLNLLDLKEEWSRLIVDDPNKAQIHVGTLKQTRYPDVLREEIKAQDRWTSAVIVRPTGWTFRGKSSKDILHVREVCDIVSIVGAPYSEHSSFDELQSCINTLRPKKIIPTVNAETKEKSKRLVDRLCNLMDLTHDKSKIDAYFRGRKDTRAPTSSGGRLVEANLPELVIGIKEEEEEDFICLADIDTSEQEKLLQDIQNKFSREVKENKSKKQRIKDYFLTK